MSASADPVALYDALNCASMAVLQAEGGERERSQMTLLEASMAAEHAFPPGSDEAKALDLILAAVAAVPEMTA